MQINSGWKLSVVIPVYNEVATVIKTLNAVKVASLPDNWSKEIIIVDDGSTDGTREILSRLDKSELIIYFRKENGGKGAALKDGFNLATGDYLIIQDADSEYDPNDYQSLLRPITEGKTEVVFGSRVLNENTVPFSRIYFYGGLLVTRIFNFLFRSHLTDLATCYKVFPRSFIKDLVKMPSDGFVFDVVELSFFLFRKVGRITEVPIKYLSRHKEEGKKMSWRQGLKCVWGILRIFAFEKVGILGRFLMRIKDSIHNFLRPKSTLQVFLVFSLFFLIFFAVYFSVGTVSSSDDHYFHFRFAQELVQNGFFHSFQDFPSIYFSKMAQGNDYFVYYNFLFYLVVIPFTFIQPLFLGIKLYAVFAVAISFAVLFICLKRIEIKNPLIWTFIFLAITNSGSIWRFFLSRPYALAPSLLLVLLILLYRRKYIGVFIVSFVYLYWHSATFFLPFCVALGYLIIQKFYRTKPDYKSFLAAVLGTTSAILLTYLTSSGFLLYMKDIIFGTYLETIIGKKVPIAEGGELYPIDFFNFIQRNALIFAAFVTVFWVDIFNYFALKFKKLNQVDYLGGISQERKTLQMVVLILTALFFLGTVAVSSRFGDYFTFFASLYIALSVDYMRRSIKVSGVKTLKLGIMFGSGIVLIYLLVSNMLFLQNSIAHGSGTTEMYQVGNWLGRNTKSGDVVFNTNWSWFPELYYYSPKNNYVSGLEPRFLYVYSPRIYWLAAHISGQGYVCDQEKCPQKQVDQLKAFGDRTGIASEKWAKSEGEKIADVLLNDFQASYVVTSREYLPLNFVMDHSKRFTKKIYNAEFGFSVYAIK